MSTISANTFLAADGTTTTEPSIPALDQRMAKAWVNFNGTGTVAIRASYNVSSITDSGVGIYDINFATAMANTNYCTTVSSYGYPTNVDLYIAVLGTQSVNSIGVGTKTHWVTNFANYDLATVTAVVMGGQ